MSSKRRMDGVTLVELVVAMVIVGIALAGLVAAYNRASIASTDPLITQQMLAIGETMMEEVMLKPYGPNDVDTIRAQFDDILDYANFTRQAVTDVYGTPVAGLERYNIGVTVGDEAQSLPGVATSDMKRIVVTVWHGQQSLVLTGWRTKP